MQYVGLKAGDIYEQAVVTIHKFVSSFDLTEGRPNPFAIDDPFDCAQDRFALGGAEPPPYESA